MFRERTTNPEREFDRRPGVDAAAPEVAASNLDAIKSQMSPRTRHAVDRWVHEQMFEEDVRAVLLMMRPHPRERLMGWSEYRTGGSHFRITVSWDDDFAAMPPDLDPVTSPPDVFAIPRLVDVMESLLLGSIRADAELSAEAECRVYRALVNALSRRIDRLGESPS
jgi:hypothetical protein